MVIRWFGERDSVVRRLGLFVGSDTAMGGVIALKITVMIIGEMDQSGNAW